ncbi:MAG: hypothetical protein RR614_05355 [Eubacterium sp.]
MGEKNGEIGYNRDTIKEDVMRADCLMMIKINACEADIKKTGRRFKKAEIPSGFGWEV